MIYKTYVPLYLSDTALFCFFAAMFFVVCFGAEVLRVIDFFRARYHRRNAVHAAEPKLSFSPHVKDLPFPTEECTFNNQITDGKVQTSVVDCFIFKVNLGNGKYKWTHAPIETQIKENRRM